METNYDYIEVYPVLIEKLTEVNIFKDSTGLFFSEIPQVAETINSSVKGYKLVLVRTDQYDFENEYSIDDIQKLGDDFYNKILENQILGGQSNIPEDYIHKFINEYNSKSVKHIRIESAEYFDHNIGDKIRVIKPIVCYEEGDIITITSFGYNRIFFEEDNEDNQGFHVSYLDLPTLIDAKFDNNNKIIILEKESESERKYTLKELKDFAHKAWLDGNYGYSNFENFFEEAIPGL